MCGGTIFDGGAAASLCSQDKHVVLIFGVLFAVQFAYGKRAAYCPRHLTARGTVFGCDILPVVSRFETSAARGTVSFLYSRPARCFVLHVMSRRLHLHGYHRRQASAAAAVFALDGVLLVFVN